MNNQQDKNIFISGSKKINILYPKVINRLNSLIKENANIFIGDCYGIDSLVQAYLYSLKYKNVTIVCSGIEPRCKILDQSWKVICLNYDNNINNFYAFKDRYMTELCDFGICIWNGKSKASKNNIERLLLNNKIVEIYINNNLKIYKNIIEFRGDYKL